MDIEHIDINSIRATTLEDFKMAFVNVKASVNAQDLQHYMDWNDRFGSFPITHEDLDD
jgi:hypothetical protein